LRLPDVTEPNPVVRPGGKDQRVVVKDFRVECSLKLFAGEVNPPDLVAVPRGLRVCLPVLYHRSSGCDRRVFRIPARRLWGWSDRSRGLHGNWRGLWCNQRRGYGLGWAAMSEGGERHPVVGAGSEYERSFIEVPGIESLLELLARSGSHLTIREPYLP
jgi:hypothetical protein